MFKFYPSSFSIGKGYWGFFVFKKNIEKRLLLVQFKVNGLELESLGFS